MSPVYLAPTWKMAGGETSPCASRGSRRVGRRLVDDPLERPQLGRGQDSSAERRELAEIGSDEPRVRVLLAAERPPSNVPADPAEPVDRLLVHPGQVATRVAEHRGGCRSIDVHGQGFAGCLPYDHHRTADLRRALVERDDLGHRDPERPEPGMDLDLRGHRRPVFLGDPQVPCLVATGDPVDLARDTLRRSVDRRAGAEVARDQRPHRSRGEVRFAGRHRSAPSEGLSRPPLSSWQRPRRTGRCVATRAPRSRSRSRSTSAGASIRTPPRAGARCAPR